MNNIPLISFIVPFYNSGKTISETIDSIFNQSYNNFDIWIINDGSTDLESIRILDKYKGNTKIHILHQENAGPSVARNLAIYQTNAEYILPLDADNLIAKDSVLEALNYMEKHAEVSAVHGNFKFFGEKDGVKIVKKFDIDKAFILSQLDTCALIRRSVFENGLKYDDALSKIGLEDWEFWINFHSKGLKSKHLDIVFFDMRVSNSSRTFQVANKNLEEIHKYVYKKHINLLAENNKKLYYSLKMLKESPDYRIGNVILKPYRWFKKSLKLNLSS